MLNDLPQVTRLLSSGARMSPHIALVAPPPPPPHAVCGARMRGVEVGGRFRKSSSSPTLVWVLIASDFR